MGGQNTPKQDLVRQVNQALLDQGFADIPATDIRAVIENANCVSDFFRACHNLPADPQAYGERFRRYGRFVYAPFADQLIFNTKLDTYYQPAKDNPDAGGVQRRFALLTEEMQNSAFLAELIRLDFSMLPIRDGEQLMPWDVGIHIVGMKARPNLSGVSSPNCPHKDGEPFTFIHLIARNPGLQGGISRIFDNDMRMLYAGTLMQPLDSLVVRDEMVYHHITPIEVLPGVDEASRTALLIDFTPLQPIKNVYE